MLIITSFQRVVKVGFEYRKTWNKNHKKQKLKIGEKQSTRNKIVSINEKVLKIITQPF